MGGNRRVASSESLIIQLLRQSGLYGRSLAFFLIILGGMLIGYVGMRSGLQADEPPASNGAASILETDAFYQLSENGEVYLEKAKVKAEVFAFDQTYRYRLQVIDRPQESIDQLLLAVKLPRPGSEETVGHRFISNGGALSVESELYDSDTILFRAEGVGTDAQLAIEFEVPKSFVVQSWLSVLKDRALMLPPAIWGGVSIALPLLAALILLVVGAKRTRSVTALPDNVDSPPSRLSPAVLGILMRGHLSNRELAATLLDLARRGHLVIRHISNQDFRFRRHAGTDKLEDFEQVLLDQIFGTNSERASAEEISFGLAQEVFSKRVSQSFILAYRQINSLGFFYTNPLKLHRRYQISGALLFLFGLVGFFSNTFIFSAQPIFLLFWLGMMIAAAMIMLLSKGLPVRTVYGDRELGKWLAFRRYLISTETINYSSHSQEKYLAYLPYAIVLDAEVEWTRRFYDLPFTQPSWYVAPDVSTIDQFANRVFPLFGYLAHVLTLNAQPASR